MSSQSFNLKGKRALVTGAAGGLGQAFAHQLHQAGAHVVLSGRHARLQDLDGLRAELGDRCSVLAMDVSCQQSIADAFAHWNASNLPLNVLINNAGMATSTLALDTSIESFDAVLSTNLRGPWLVAREFASTLVAAGEGGSAINIASILGSRVGVGTAPYAASKAALLQLSRAMALEWARHRIRVNTLSPGYIETDLNRAFFASEAGAAALKRIPQRRLGTTDDLRAALLMLASDGSGYMTGSDIVIDGGHLCSAL